MRTGELLAACFWLAIALGITWSGWELGLGSLVDPGPGGMIFWVGLVMTALALATLAAALRQAAGPGLASLWQGTRWWLVPYVVALLAVHAWLLPALGFIASTAALLLVLFATIDRRSWFAPPIGAVLVTAAAYIVFHRWLGTQLPAGEAERWLGEHLPFIFGRA
jgi:putative tricarboxylic transport membrane protein